MDVFERAAVGETGEALGGQHRRAGRNAQQRRGLFRNGDGLVRLAGGTGIEPIPGPEHLVERRLGEDEILDTGHEVERNIGFLQAHRLAVREPQPAQPEQRCAGADVELGGDVGRRRDHPLFQHARGRDEPVTLHFPGEAFQLAGAFFEGRPLHERAAALFPADVSELGEIAQRLPNGDLTDAEARDQRIFGGQPFARPPAAPLDLSEQGGLELVVSGTGRPASTSACGQVIIMICSLAVTINLRSFVVLIALIAVAARPAAAQTVTGTIQGTVTDTSGGVLPGVTITLTQVETGTERAIVTNAEGIYSAPFLQIGTYSVKAELTGFGPVIRQNIDVRLNDTRVVDIKLNPRVTQEVTVTAEVSKVNLTNAEIKGSLTAEQIMDKPSLSASSFLSLAETFTGFQDNPTSGQNNPTASSGSSINFNGTGTRGATFQINGVNNDDSSENQNRQGAALSTILEFQVLKNGYSAEFGRGDGAVVLVQTKSGTNQYHGDLYLYQQNGAWNAKSFFAQAAPKPIRHRSEYGFTLGGPVMQNKLFAFGNVDRTKSDGENTYTRDFFTPAELAAPRLTRGNNTPENRAWINSILARFPSTLVNNDARSARTFAGVAGFNFPDEDASGRLDWNIARGNTLTGRYQWTRQIRDPQDVIVGEQAYQKNRQQNLGITWTRVFTSSMVGEARYGLGVRSTNVDIADGNDTPIVRFTASPVSGSIIGNAGNFPIHRDQKDHQFVYNLTTQAFRTHSFKTGVDIRRQALDDLADNFSRGFWTFNASCGGVTYASPYAAMLDGCVQSFQKAYGPFFLENRQNEANCTCRMTGASPGR